MAAPKGISYEQVEEALLENYGNIVAVAAELGLSRATIYYYIDNYKTCARAFEEGRRQLVDLAEAVLVHNLKMKNLGAAALVLKTLGKDRGWGESIDVTSGGSPLQVEVEYAKDEDPTS